ncbi:GNAT family N-acetyltransferase [Kitasatospora sp. NPDC096147]|uniref:GNAT family N-acetyltransferase n=1 Tax=Kitasatospora sp. NPDC096147 TaxID=3364093 RepID=UPI00381F2D3B
MSVQVGIAREADGELVAAFARLLPQLSSSAVPLDREAVARLLACSANTVLLARLEGRIVGTLTLVLLPLPSGQRARIEDVVVDGAARGHGVGAALTAEAVRLAEAAGARTVDLTSRPSREAANRLYERAGFEVRGSVVYRRTAGVSRGPGTGGVA